METRKEKEQPKRKFFFGRKGEYISHSKLIGEYTGKRYKRLDREFYVRKISKGLQLGSKYEANIELFEEKGRFDLCRWIITIIGPIGTPYESGVFRFEFRFPDAYPFRAPNVIPLQKIFLPLHEGIIIEKDGKKEIGGKIEFPLNSVENGWRSAMGVREDPGSGSGNDDIMVMYQTDLQKFNKIAREWTNKYANNLPWTCKKQVDNFELERVEYTKDLFVSILSTIRKNNEVEKKFLEEEDNIFFCSYVTIRLDSFVNHFLSIPKWI